MRFILVMLIYLAGTVMAARGVVFAACLFLWSDIFQPLTFAKDQGGLPVAKLVLAVLILSYMVGWFRGRFTPRLSTFFYLLCGLMAWGGICSALSDYPDTAWENYLIILKYVGPLAFIHTAIRTRWEIKMLAGCLAASVGIWAAQAGAHCLVNGVNTDLGIEGGQMGERNDFAAAIVGTLPALLYFIFSRDIRFKWIVRPFLGAMAFLGLMAIFFSLSRGASVGLGASVLLYVIYVSKSRFRDFAVLLVVLAGVLMILPKDYFERMRTIKLGTEQTEDSAAARMNLMTGAMHATFDHPIFGLGPGCWLEVVKEYTGDDHNPHSIYLVLSSETGIVGLALYLLVILYTYFQISSTIKSALKRGDKETARLGSALIMSVFGLLSAMTFLNRPFNEYLWAWISIANALPVIYRRELQARKRPIPAAGSAPSQRAKRARPGMAPPSGALPPLPGAALS